MDRPKSHIGAGCINNVNREAEHSLVRMVSSLHYHRNIES